MINHASQTILYFLSPTTIIPRSTRAKITSLKAGHNLAFNLSTRTLSLLHQENLVLYENRLTRNEAHLFVVLWLAYPEYAPDPMLVNALFCQQLEDCLHIRTPAPLSPTSLLTCDVDAIERCMTNLRKKLAPFQITLKRIWETGYILQPTEVSPQTLPYPLWGIHPNEEMSCPY